MQTYLSVLVLGRQAFLEKKKKDQYHSYARMLQM